MALALAILRVKKVKKVKKVERVEKAKANAKANANYVNKLTYKKRRYTS